MVAYTVLVPIFFGVDEDDLIRLTIAVDTTGPLRSLFGALLGIERRVLHLRGGGRK